MDKRLILLAILFYLINIDKLEEITGYDFLSNLPSEIQEAIEGRKYPDILEEIYNKRLM
ncbi:MAG: hypothetical protein KME59_17875 [Trichormus sp. ATA11-4-KO1]|jgi:DNA/RNA endonuclease G (NUC1)|nr:hypothetical protein [Trichormus sp. ATA11-4-KO1]